MADITLLGEADTGDPDKYGLTIHTDDKKWVESEPGSASKILITKRGTYVVKPAPETGTSLLNALQEPVCFLRNFIPSTANVGDRGQGNAFETGRTIDWEVESLALSKN